MDQLIEALGLLARLQHQRRRIDAGAGKAFKQSIEMCLRHVPIRHHRAPYAGLARGNLGAGAGNKSGADDDVIAAICQIDTDGL